MVEYHSSKTGRCPFCLAEGVVLDWVTFSRIVATRFGIRHAERSEFIIPPAGYLCASCAADNTALLAKERKDRR